MQHHPREPVRIALYAILISLIGCSVETDTETGPFQIAEIAVPTAADSMAANLAMGPGGETVLSWIDRQEDADSLRYSRWINDGWDKPATVASGDNWFVNWADFPSVVPITSSLWGAHWLVRQPAGGYAYDALSAVSTDGGNSWSDGAALHRDGTETEHGFVTLHPQGNGIGAIWLDGRNMVNEVGPDPGDSGMTLRSATITPAAQLVNEQQLDGLTCDCCQTDVAITSDGPIAVYRDRTVDEIRDIYVARMVNGRWQPGAAVNDDGWEIAGCPVNGPVINANGDNVIVAWFTAAENLPQVRLATSTDAGRTFSPPVTVINNDTLGRVAAALLHDGSTVVAWLSKSSGDGAQLLLRRIQASGEPGPVHVVSDDVASFSVPQMLALDSQLLLAWTGVKDERTQVRSALVSLNNAVR